MLECKECQKSFDEILSAKNVSELREFNWNPKLISDSPEPEFCSKWCQKLWHEKNDEPVETEEIFISKCGEKKYGASDMASIYKDLNNPLYEIAKNKDMMKVIMSGNASDKGFKKEVESIERKRVNEAKEKSRDIKREKLQTVKDNYKRKYGVDPI